MFLPKEYDVPTASSGNYMKLEEGDNVFRVLGSAITGWEYWTKENKPVRARQKWGKTPDDAKLTEGKFSPKHFWAFPVWNYKTEKVQILELTQATIQKAIKGLVDDPDWGDPREYDISVKRSGEGLDTEYSVNPKPKKELSPVIKRQFMDKTIILEELFDGGDPFNATTSDGDPIPEF